MGQQPDFTTACIQWLRWNYKITFRTGITYSRSTNKNSLIALKGARDKTAEREVTTVNSQGKP